MGGELFGESGGVGGRGAEAEGGGGGEFCDQLGFGAGKGEGGKIFCELRRGVDGDGLFGA